MKRSIPIRALISMLATTLALQALPPRQHSVNGVVEASNWASRTITLKSKDRAAPLTLVWNDSTRSTRKDGCARCSLDSGQTVHGWFLREAGHNVLREVSTKGASAACGAGCRVETHPRTPDNLTAKLKVQ